jgi:hypothetical protein
MTQATAERQRVAITKQQAADECRNHFAANPEEFPRGSVAKKREFWRDYLRTLRSTGLITLAQVRSWTCPF